MRSFDHLHSPSIIIDSSVFAAILTDKYSENVEDAAQYLVNRIEEKETKAYISAPSYLDILTEHEMEDEAVEELEITLSQNLHISVVPILKKHVLDAYQFQSKNEISSSLAFNMALAKEQGNPLVVAIDQETVGKWGYVDGVEIVVL